MISTGTIYSAYNLQFANEAPAIMQLFHSHGISCDRIETEALKLSAHNEPSESNPNKDEPLKLCNDMLESLGRFSISISTITSITEPNKYKQKLCRKKQGILKVLSSN